VIGPIGIGHYPNIFANREKLKVQMADARSGPSLIHKSSVNCPDSDEIEFPLPYFDFSEKIAIFMQPNAPARLPVRYSHSLSSKKCVYSIYFPFLQNSKRPSDERYNSEFKFGRYETRVVSHQPSLSVKTFRHGETNR
jgi:hypothetical protein